MSHPPLVPAAKWDVGYASHSPFNPVAAGVCTLGITVRLGVDR